MKTSISTKRILALLLAIVMAIGLAGCNGKAPDNAPSVIVDPETGIITEIPSPDANSSSSGGSDWWTKYKDGKDSKDDKDSDGHVPGTQRDSKPMLERNIKAYGDIVTVVKSVSKPTAANTKNTSDDTKYGKVDWSTAAQGYITFTAKGQQREFILEGPNGKQALFTLQKDETIKISLIDGTGKYQYAIANNTNGGKSYKVQYKNSFTVSKIDSDLAPYLVSNPYGDYENAPVAVAKADELWDTNKTIRDNVQAIAKYVGGLKYDKKLKMGTIDVYVNPDKVIENGGGVCNEMAKTLVAMLRSQGIPAYMQNGTNAKGNSHGWVMAWLELSTETKNGTTYSTGTWVLIEATGGLLTTKSVADKDYTPSNYAN